MAEKKEESEKAEEKAAPSKKPKKSLPIIPLILGALYFGGSGGAVFLIFKSVGFESSFVRTEEQEKKVYVDAKDTLPVMNLFLFPLETFFLNLRGGRGTDQLKLTVQLEVFDAETMSELKLKLPIIRDAVIRHVSEKSRADLDSVQDKLFLKTQLVNIINNLLITGSIRNIYVTHFLVQ